MTKRIDFTKNRRILNLDPEQIKNLLNSNARDFANKEEKRMYSHFNIVNIYYINNKKFLTYELAKEHLIEFPTFKEEDIQKEYVLLMNKQIIINKKGAYVHKHKR